MFIAFWMSFISMIILIIPLMALSDDPKVVIFSHWMYAHLNNAEYSIALNTTNYIIKTDNIHIYAGTFLLVQRCDLNYNDECSFSKGWLSHDTCTNDNTYCYKCSNACIRAFTTAFFGLLSMFPQMLIDIQRSTEAGDLNCLKWIGQLLAIIGFVSTLISLWQFYYGCFIYAYNDLHNQGYDVNVGLAYTCVFIATWLKPFDFWVHWIVPVSEIHWNPEHPKYSDSNHQRIVPILTDDDNNNNQHDEESDLAFVGKSYHKYKKGYNSKKRVNGDNDNDDDEVINTGTFIVNHDNDDDDIDHDIHTMFGNI